MRIFLKIISGLSILLFLSACSKTEGNQAKTKPQNQKATIIYLVRHAEKSNQPPTDPNLSDAGKAWAEALKTLLEKENITAIFSSNYNRTKQTAQPLAQAKQLSVSMYDPNDLPALAKKILTENRNQTVLIVGHSNTVLETIEAFKLPRPMAAIAESEYDHLFKITIPEKGKATVTATRYGN